MATHKWKLENEITTEGLPLCFHFLLMICQLPLVIAQAFAPSTSQQFVLR